MSRPRPQALTTQDAELIVDYLRPQVPRILRVPLALRRIRNYTIALLLLDAGLRVSEAAHLPTYCLAYESTPNPAVHVPASIAKSNRARSIPMSPRLSQAITLMIRCLWVRYPSDPHSFAFYSSNPKTPIAPRQIQRIIRSAALAAIGRPVHPHILRHTFATRLLQFTNIRVVQELLGHASIQSTQIYTHPTDQDKAMAILQSFNNLPNNHRPSGPAG